MKKVFIAFTDDEFKAIEKKAKEVGFSIPKLIEYATCMYIDLPRINTVNLAQIKNKINHFIQKFEGDSFICATPFGNDWNSMSTSSKRTAAAQMKKLVDQGIIEKIEPTSKAHQATVYRKK